VSGDAVGSELVGGCLADLDHRTPRNQGDIVTRPHGSHFPKIDNMLTCGHLALERAIELLGLEEDYRVIVADRCGKQALGIGGRFGRHHL